MRTNRFSCFVVFPIVLGLIICGFGNPLLARQRGDEGAEVLTALERYFEFEGTLQKSDLEVLDSLLPTAEGEMRGSLPLRLAIAAATARDSGQPAILSRYSSRIIGGIAASPSEFPWQVALVAAGYPAYAAQFCGGSIVDELWILTAAHCVDQTAPSQLYVFAGSIDLADNSAQRRNVAKIYPNTWNPTNQQNDIALIQLTSPLNIVKSRTEIVALPSTSGAPANGSLLTVSGWGATAEGGAGTPILRKVVVPVVDFQQCNGPNFYDGAVLRGMLCAGIGGKDSCQGDSGGPLVSLQGRPLQVGIVSWGDGCARPNKPGVYTDVASYVDWIATTISQ